MNNQTIYLKIKQRLNKLASNDYDNIECWQVVEAFNKGMVEWCRRNLHGINQKQEGDEQSKRRIDDLQKLMVTQTITMSDKQLYYESPVLPTNYLEWKRVSAKSKNNCCEDPRRMVIYLAEEANVDELLRDKNKQPSFEWAETFVTLIDNKFRIYTDNKFEVQDVVLTYYRQPVRIQILNCVDPYTQLASTQEVECEFKDDLVELFVDEAVKILAGDIESMNQYTRAQQSVEGNN
jgi:hypothetical protein